jgi:hypothetical protein
MGAFRVTNGLRFAHLPASLERHTQAEGDWLILNPLHLPESQNRRFVRILLKPAGRFLANSRFWRCIFSPATSMTTPRLLHLPEVPTKVGNGWDDEIRKLRALRRVGAGMAVLFLVLVVITFLLHGLH